jgi:hypothetical protein
VEPVSDEILALRTMSIMKDQSMVDWKFLSLTGEVKHDAPNEPNFKPTVTFQVHVSRLHYYWIYNVIIPLFLLYSLLWFGFAIPYDVQSRLEYVLSVLGLVLFFKFIISSRIPEISYTTILDNWMFICFSNGILVGFGLAIACFISNYDHAVVCDKIFATVTLFMYAAGCAQCLVDAKKAISSSSERKA